MITRLRIQNYKSISDLTLEIGSKNLLMGLNGSGKTAVFDVLAGIRELVVEGEKCERVFPLSTVPRWINVTGDAIEQSIDLEVESPWGFFKYSLTLEQDRQRAQSDIRLEHLILNDTLLFGFADGRVGIHDGDRLVGAPYGASANRSILATIQPGIAIESELVWFRDFVRSLHVVRIDAPRISSRSEKSAVSPARDLSNFASWYRQAFVADTNAGASFLTAIKEIIDGIEGLNLRDIGQGIAVLEAALKQDKEVEVPKYLLASRKYTLDFSELSDGQRALAALYALAHFLIREGSTLCIDEPDNFIALAEIQPWLNTALDLVDDNGGQLIIASHHPEFYNLLAPDHGIVLKREGAGPTTAERYRHDDESPLTPAERVAMGEVNG